MSATTCPQQCVLVCQGLKLDSANSLLHGLPTFLIDLFQNVQNAAVRIITRTKKYDHIKSVLKQLHWLPVNQRINYKILLLTFKALNGQAPSYITELLEPYRPARNLRSSSKNLLKIPLVKLIAMAIGVSVLQHPLYNNNNNNNFIDPYT